jgi:predicted nucleic acid-binding protein
VLGAGGGRDQREQSCADRPVRPIEGTPALILSALIDSEFEAVVCSHLLEEVSRGLESEHFRQRLRAGQAADILTAISESAVHFPDPETPE